ncbi:30S ribosomal protein S4 [Candidatus Uhrbacteria bacterium]|nr:30S ribosomal protein S4 [Candidatus Uhrbacteria bacterium]
MRILMPKCRQCRAAGEKLFLKGDRCFTAKCAITRRNYRPGVHGPSGTPRLSEFGEQLKAKQKAKRIYGLMERQFSNYYKKALKQTGDTGEILTGYLETRLDNVVYRLGWAKSRSQARQVVSHGHITVNGHKVNISSYQVRIGEVIGIDQKSKEIPLFKNLTANLEKWEMPAWLTMDKTKLEGKILSLPSSDDLKGKIDAKMIVEFYSR